VARIRTSGLLSAVAIDIRAGESESMLESGSHIRGQGRVDVFAAVTDAANTLRDLTEDEIRPLIKNVSKYIDTFGQALSKDGSALLADLAVVADKLEQRGPELIENFTVVSGQARELLGPPNSDNLADILADLATASSNVAALTEDERLSATLGNIERASANIEQITDSTGKRLEELLGEQTVVKVRQALDDVANAARNVATLSSELISTRKKIDALLEQAHGLVTDTRPDLSQAVGDLRYMLHTIARHIDAITYNLEGTSRNMYEFSRQIRNNPGVLLSGKAPADNATATSQ
jgi:phospholipid/cholesterol/gamma-HCH transport system substrate-binding protein